MPSISDQVDALAAARKAIDTTAVLEQLRNTEFPVEDRWRAYTELVKAEVITANECYGDGYLHELDNNLTQYDDFNNDRHTTVKFIDMYDAIMEADEWYPRLQAVRDRPEGITAWQEKVLASGNASFDYDW